MTVILDGGLGTELEARGHDLSDRLWSARLLLSDPDAVEEVHLAYYRAGAQVATTGSYQATIPGFASGGLDRHAAIAAIRASVEIARRARDRYSAESGTDAESLLVAGSVGPYGAMLADGSEYRGDYDPGVAALRELHAPRMEALLEGGADLLAMETIPNLGEAEVLVTLLDEFDASGWLAYQCRDGTSIAAGDPR
jgi:homocysteine S-methyltransferase